MRGMIRVLGYCIIVLGVLFLSSYAFAQEKPVELTTAIVKIPTARIIDWAGMAPTINGIIGWQEQALSQDDLVCCIDDGNPATQNFVLVALNKSAENIVRLEEGTCLVINEVAGMSVDSVDQDSGESLFDLGLLEEGSTFEVDTPTATIGVSGTTFNVKVVDADGDSTTVVTGDYTIIQVLEADTGPTAALTVDDKYPDSGDLDTPTAPEYTLSSTDQLEVIIGSPNEKKRIEGDSLTSCGLRRQISREIATERQGPGWIHKKGDGTIYHTGPDDDYNYPDSED